MSKRAGFTLVELLVVIGIVALLIGVLLPVLGRARVAGQQSVSVSNLRQLQLANTVYATEHDDRYVAGAPRFRTHNLERWHGVRDNDTVPFEAERAPIAQYLEGGAVSQSLRTCPAFEPVSTALQESGRGFENSCGGYGYNNAFVGTIRAPSGPGSWGVRDDTRGERSSRFAQPTETIGFATTAFAADELIEYSFVEPPKWPEFPDYRPDPSIHFRFGGSAAVVWLDGHCSTPKRDFTYRSGIYRANPDDLQIGWFGDVEENTLFDHR